MRSLIRWFTRIVFLFVFCFAFFTTKNAFASKLVTSPWDTRVGFAAQSIPFGGNFYGTLGYNFLVWGKDPRRFLPIVGPPGGESAVDWRFGYARMSGSAQTIALSNRAAFELDIFPISILGVTLGKAVQHRLNSSSQFNCSTSLCGGVLDRSYVRLQSIVGVPNLFLMFWGRMNWVNHASNQTLPFVEETNALVGASGGDRMVSFSSVIGHAIHESWVLGVSVQTVRMLNSGNKSHTGFAFANYFYDRYTFLLGAGVYHSTHQALSPMLVGLVQLTGDRPLGWF